MEIDQLRDRIDEVLSRVTETPESRSPAIAAGLEELRHLLAEFVASGEELYQKIEELLATRAVLDKERARYRDLFDLAPDAHIVTDFEGRIRLANRAAATLLQVRLASLESQSLLSFLGEPDRTLLLRHVTELSDRAPDVPQQWRLTIRPRQEESFPAVLILSPILPAGTSEAGLHWVLRESAASPA
jgi:PAS domain S-box-containing protein